MKKIFFLLLTAVLTGVVTNASAAPTAPQKAPDGYKYLDYEFIDATDYPDVDVYGTENTEVGNDSWANCIFLYVNDAESAVTFDVNVTSDAVFSFIFDGSCRPFSFSVLIDGQSVDTIGLPEDTGRMRPTIDNTIPFCYPLAAGAHTIKIVAEQSHAEGLYAYTRNVAIKDLKVVNTPLISVELLEPGSLGTEILYNDVERLQDVRALKITGTMDDDDWEKVRMMGHNLYYLDLSDAVIANIPDEVFKDCTDLYYLSLPEGLESIGDYAFYRTALLAVDLPESLASVGAHAFAHASLRQVTMHDNVADLGASAFEFCYLLENIHLSNALKSIAIYTFSDCFKVNIDKLPDEVETIGENAFYNCYNVNFDLPSCITEIGRRAFYYTNNNPDNIKDTLIWPESCIDAEGGYAFAATSYKTVVLPVGINRVNIPGYYYYGGPTFYDSDVEKIVIKSATVVTLPEGYPYDRWVNDDVRGDIDLEVPAYLVNAYKLDPYWYNFKSIKGFDTEEVDHWIIRDNLVLGARERMLGTPSITITNTGSLKINGTNAMPINNLHLESVPTRWGDGEYAMMMSNADGVTINGQLSTDIRLDTGNQWYYLSLPYDVKVGDIQSLDGTQMAIRYYDGANRAANGPTGSWTNYGTDDIITAGTGFIINTNHASTWRFIALDTDNKQNISSIEMFCKPLITYASDVASDMGWNLVGNPYQCYYNIHKLNFTAPITVRDLSNNTYSAYSIIDDDYALRPNQAFFVQCPEGVSEIGFPHDGRQFSPEVLSQQGAPAHAAVAADRHVMDITIAAGEMTDRTRVVINDMASSDYEPTCDASKFFSDAAAAAEIYTIGDDATAYAINERPMLEGIVDLGFKAAAEGSYTIALTRGDMEHVYLTDLYTGEVTDLTLNDYTFASEGGTYADRFTLTFEGATSAISSMSFDGLKVQATTGGIAVCAQGMVEVYNLAGMRVASAKADGLSCIPVAKGTYIVKAGSKVVKVSVN